MAELQAYLEDIKELKCVDWVALLARQIVALGDDVLVTVSAFGLRFTRDSELLCELSVFGEMCIVRTAKCVEYRVRNEVVALAALDHVVAVYLDSPARGAAGRGE